MKRKTNLELINKVKFNSNNRTITRKQIVDMLNKKITPIQRVDCYDQD